MRIKEPETAKRTQNLGGQGTDIYIYRERERD